MSKNKYGLVGGALGHSFSPRIHAELGDYLYELFPMDEEAFDKFFTEKDFMGVNVTIPYKKRVIPFLDEMTDIASKVGAINTVANRGGKLCGTNTDYTGFIYMAEHANIHFEGKKVLILGSGGAARAAIAVARDKGAKEVITVSRTGEVNYTNVYEHADTEIIVNTTPVGMFPNCPASPIDISRFKNLCGVLDVVYNPLRTALLLDAKRLGIPHANGLSMLVAQAAAANEFFFGKSIEKEKIDMITKKIEKSSSNIVLIGMPGCGKSSIGRIVAKMLDMEFVDADDEITKSTGRTPAEIISCDGESAFRDIETSVIAELGKRGGILLSCGGGVIVREENYAHLKQNGNIFYIKREISKLERSGRPLSAGDGQIEKLYEARREKYERFADFEIENDSTPELAAEKIKNLFTKN